MKIDGRTFSMADLYSKEKMIPLPHSISFHRKLK
jgi:hypothetical protein